MRVDVVVIAYLIDLLLVLMLALVLVLGHDGVSDKATLVLALVPVLALILVSALIPVLALVLGRVRGKANEEKRLLRSIVLDLVLVLG